MMSDSPRTVRADGSVVVAHPSELFPDFVLTYSKEEAEAMLSPIAPIAPIAPAELFAVLYLRAALMVASSFSVSGHFVYAEAYGPAIAPDGDADAEARRDPASDMLVTIAEEWRTSREYEALSDLRELLPLVDVWLADSLDFHPEDREGVWRAYVDAVRSDPRTHGGWGTGFVLRAVGTD